MATALSAPALKADTVYSDWKLEVELWQDLTDVPENKQGLALANAIAADHPLAIRQQVLKNLGRAKLKAEEGVENLFTYLESILGVESEDERKVPDNMLEERKESEEEREESEENEESEEGEESEESEEKATQDADRATTVKGIQKLKMSKPSADEEVVSMSPTTEKEWQSFQEERRRKKQGAISQKKKEMVSLQPKEEFPSENMTKPKRKGGVRNKKTITTEAENDAAKLTKEAVASHTSAITEEGVEAAESFFKGEEIPHILMSVLTDRLSEKFGNRGPLQVIGLVLSTLAMSEIGMLLGVISNPLTVDFYKLAQIKQTEMLKSIDKKLDKIMGEPLRSATETLSDVFDLLKEGQHGEARKLLKTVQAKAQIAKNFDLPFPMHAQAVKIFIFAEIMMLQYDSGEENRDETGQPTPCFMPTFKLKKHKKDMIFKKLLAAKGELEKFGKKKRTIIGKTTEIIKDEFQNVIDGFLQAQYNVMSICRDFTNPTKMVDREIKFKLATDFIPCGEEDSTPLPLGLLEKEQEALVCWVWRDPDNAFLRIGMRKFTLQLKHARNMEIKVQVTKTSDGKYYDCHYGEDHKKEAQPANGQLPPKMKKIQDLLAEAKHATSVSDLSLEAYQAAAGISPDYLKFLKIDFSEVDRDDSIQNTLLHFIAKLPCKDRDKAKAKTIIDIIVNSGGKEILTKQNAGGISPLMKGLQNKQKCMPILQILLELIETDEAQDANGDTLVHHAARFLQDKDLGFLSLILDKLGRGFLRSLNNDEKAPFDIASSPKIKKALGLD